MSFSFRHPYVIDQAFAKPVAYFCMEYAIHQPLKLYAGGLGYLAGSHMRSAFERKQNMVGIGILWKYGYYDQIRKADQTMDVLFQEKAYGFLQRTDIKFTIKISSHDVWVTAWYLPPEVFGTVPIFFLSTELPENDYLSKTITHRLYDPNPQTRIAADILLGAGGAKLLEELKWTPEVYHFNESHALPLGFYLHSRYKNPSEVQKRLVFTSHTPEEAGNPKTDIFLLEKMGFFCGLPITEVKAVTGTSGNIIDHTLSALKMAGKANAVSKLHYETVVEIYKKYTDICPLVYITNAQNFNYWANHQMYSAVDANDDKILRGEKLKAKQLLFELVADQNGEIFDKDILTIVFAKRFAGYKRPDLLLHNIERVDKIVKNHERPVQIIWAGKPYPVDYAAIATFDRIVNLCRNYVNCATLIGYELKLSKFLKQGADVWLNNPRLTHEASGTSGMSAAMNGAINLGTLDGWFPEFAKDKENCFVIPAIDTHLDEYKQDEADANSLYEVLEKEIIPMYYDYPLRWSSMIKKSMNDIIPRFNSSRLAAEYYEKLYM